MEPSPIPGPNTAVDIPKLVEPNDKTPTTLPDVVPENAIKTEVKPTPINPLLGLMVSLKVQKGNTISIIAKQYGVTVESIQKENNLKPGVILKEGQCLIIPIPKDHLYQLKPKETLWRIAKRYGTTVEILKEINKVTDVSNLEVGADNHSTISNK